MTVWDSLDAMERSRVAATRARTDAAQEAGAEVTSTYEFEVGIHTGERARSAASASTRTPPDGRQPAGRSFFASRLVPAPG